MDGHSEAVAEESVLFLRLRHGSLTSYQDDIDRAYTWKPYDVAHAQPGKRITPCPWRLTLSCRVGFRERGESVEGFKAEETEKLEARPVQYWPPRSFRAPYFLDEPACQQAVEYA